MQTNPLSIVLWLYSSSALDYITVNGVLGVHTGQHVEIYGSMLG